MSCASDGNIALGQSNYLLAGFIALGVCLAMPLSPLAPAALAQTSSQDRNAQRAEVNAAAVMIAASHPDTSMMKIADDMSVVLDDPQSGLRIVPVVGDGAIGNIRDVILLRNIDLGLTDLTALEHMRRSQNLSQFLAREIAHVVTLFPDKLSIMARTNISGIKALNGKKVSVGSKDGGAALHSEKIFKAFGINAQAVHLAPVDSAEALVKGEIDAFICFCLASPGVYQRVMFNTNLHMLPIPFEGGLQRDYLPATLTHEDFPSFISKGESVETVAVTLALVTYNWEKGNPRYNRVAKFVEQLFNNIQKFQSPARHKGWQSVQISATAPGWSRFAAAAEWQSSQRADAIQDMRVAFSEFLGRWATESSASSPPIKPTEQIKLFEEFLEWRQTPR